MITNLRGRSRDLKIHESKGYGYGGNGKQTVIAHIGPYNGRDPSYIILSHTVSIFKFTN